VPGVRRVVTEGNLQPAAIEVLAHTPEMLRTLLDRLPASLLEAPADDDWSPKDVVAHLLITTQVGALDRIHSMIEQDHPLLHNRDEDEELKQSGFRSKPLAELLEELARRREADTAWLRTLDASAFARTGEHSAVGHVTAEEMLHHAAYHDTLHLAHLMRMLGTHFEPLRGGMRAF
jgi:hypothetical protein